VRLRRQCRCTPQRLGWNWPRKLGPLPTVSSIGPKDARCWIPWRTTKGRRRKSQFALSRRDVSVHIRHRYGRKSPVPVLASSGARCYIIPRISRTMLQRNGSAESVAGTRETEFGRVPVSAALRPGPRATRKGARSRRRLRPFRVTPAHATSARGAGRADAPARFAPLLVPAMQDKKRSAEHDPRRPTQPVTSRCTRTAPSTGPRALAPWLVADGPAGH
jgi:hypothetical protein